MRFLVKEALYNITYRCDYSKALKRLIEAYNLLLQGSIAVSALGVKRQITEEQRDNADIVAVIVLKMYLSSNQKARFLDFFKAHFLQFKFRAINFEELKWRANWFNLVATMLEAHHRKYDYSVNKKDFMNYS